jgi:hypothetical protein
MLTRGFFPIDTAIRSIVRSGRTEAREDVPPGHQMDLEPGRAPVRRPLYRGRVRPQAMLVRSGAERQTIQGPSVSQGKCHQLSPPHPPILSIIHP